VAICTKTPTETIRRQKTTHTQTETLRSPHPTVSRPATRASLTQMHINKTLPLDG